jgi:hypothetical protein
MLKHLIRESRLSVIVPVLVKGAEFAVSGARWPFRLGISHRMCSAKTLYIVAKMVLIIKVCRSVRKWSNNRKTCCQFGSQPCRPQSLQQPQPWAVWTIIPIFSYVPHQLRAHPVGPSTVQFQNLVQRKQRCESCMIERNMHFSREICFSQMICSLRHFSSLAHHLHAMGNNQKQTQTHWIPSAGNGIF